ncbi:hypothetical protein GPECTOR_7g1167 [Gonium pectorale]|uniref:RING-type domain-containing protein n=1 Tax=Gonium pectorale TaxID=33097 RepID=A0A150GU48_GONPE|nr:hypothetical protein GPECTOR_7g1167 [Gonium pectorale]|eukprot:KXZ53273.1 hypothetical protein GPECTOR_7g1167 [Gonium pectorale]
MPQEPPALEEEDLDVSQPEWWRPQPHATLDEADCQERPAAPLTRALSCQLCGELLREAMTAPECGHTYCYDCIESRVEIGGNHNVCPVPGCGAVLGPNPFDHHRLLYDTLLDGLVRKIFPRPQLDAALAARRAEREEETRRARAAVNGHRGAAVAGGRGGGKARSPGTRNGVRGWMPALAEEEPGERESEERDEEEEEEEED